ALPWIAPSLVLIFGVVLFPAAVMFYNSTRDISQSGVDRGGVGLANYAEVFGFAYFWPIFFRTIWWVVAVVFFTVIISLALAQILNKAFPRRKLVLLLVIIPSADSVGMTTMVSFYALAP